MNYDVIGDIHGQADKLQALLRNLGYRHTAAGWRPPAGTTAVFVGDLIDRGARQKDTVEIVRAMVDAGVARCVLGNHEYNAIAFTVQAADGSGPLRPHSARNLEQHGEFLQQVGEGSALHRELVDWFRTLPPALDLGPLRVVHAWWNPEYLALVQQRTAGKPLDDAFMQEAAVRGSPLWRAMEGLTILHLSGPMHAVLAARPSMARDIRVNENSDRQRHSLGDLQPCEPQSRLWVSDSSRAR